MPSLKDYQKRDGGIGVLFDSVDFDTSRNGLGGAEDGANEGTASSSYHHHHLDKTGKIPKYSEIRASGLH